MGRRERENTGFTCENCRKEVAALTNGSYRNHCPRCLYSKHVDHTQGDRLSRCGGLMAPVGLDFRGDKGFQIVHQCLRCRTERKNRVAVDTVQPDDLELLASLSGLEDAPPTGSGLPPPAGQQWSSSQIGK